MIFQAPVFLILLFLIPMDILFYLYFLKKGKKELLHFSDLSTLKSIGAEVKPWRKYGSFFLELLLLLIFILALARPQGLVLVPSSQLVMVMCFDTSGSMMAQDFFPSREGAAKEAALGFVEHQPFSFPMGVITFSDTAQVILPPTPDKHKVIAAIHEVQAHLGGTAIGDAIFSALSLLSSYPQPHKVILLLSDGANNMGSDPLVAAQAARNQGVKIFTIGVGTPEGTYIPGIPEKVVLDEKTLKAIANITGGEYHRVTDTESLRKIFLRLSRTITIVKKYGDITWDFVVAGFLLLCIKFVMDVTLFRRLP